MEDEIHICYQTSEIRGDTHVFEHFSIYLHSLICIAWRSVPK